MREEQIEAAAYAGYREEECPREFLLDGTRIEVRKVLRQWCEETAGTGELRRCFTVKGSDFRTHTLCYHEGTMTWLYRR